jgi:cell wall-associated NlpC family hydrolase
MIKYEHLLGLPFIHGKQDCLTMIQRFYADNFNIEIMDHARPDEWWDQGLDLYTDNYHKAGFRVMDDLPVRDLKIGDVLLMAIMSTVPCHGAVYIGGGKILHHFYGRLSEVTDYKGLWRNSTTAILRHKSNPEVTVEVESKSLIDLLPQHMRKKALDALAGREIQRG